MAIETRQYPADPNRFPSTPEEEAAWRSTVAHFGMALEKNEGQAIEYDPGAPKSKLTWGDYRFNVRSAWRGLKASPLSWLAQGELVGALSSWPYYVNVKRMRRKLAKWIAGPDTGW